MALLSLASPAFSQSYQYNVFVKGFKGRAGTGDGAVVIDPNDPNGTNPASKPKLILSSSTIQFTDADTTSDGALVTTGVAASRLGVSASDSGTSASIQKFSTLTNVGTGPAVLTDFSSTSNFLISSDCPIQLEPQASCTIGASLQAATAGHKLDIVTIQAVGIPSLALSLEAHLDAGPVPNFVFSPAKLNFGLVVPGTPATLETTLTNSGTLAGSVTGLISSIPFDVSHNCPSTLAVSDSCTVSVSVGSGAKGEQQSSLIVPSTPRKAANLMLLAQVSAAPKYTVTPRYLSFTAKDTSDSKSAIITNTGNAEGPLPEIVSDADYNLRTDCGPTLAASAYCTVYANANKSSPGDHARTISLPLANQSSLSTLELRSKVDTPATEAKLEFLPPTLDFGTLNSGMSASLTASLTNSGALTAQLQSVGFASKSDFVTQTNDCGTTLEPGASCTVQVNYTAQRSNVSVKNLTVVEKNNTKTILDLVGSSLFAQVTAPSQVDFGLTRLTAGKVVRPVTISNTGTSAIQGLAVSQIEGPYSVEGGNCTTSLDAKNTCSLQVSYNASTSGIQEGTLVLVSSNGGTATVALLGQATTASLTATPNKLVFGETAVGNVSAIQSVALQNIGEDMAAIKGISVIEGASNFSQSSNCGTSLAGGSSCIMNVLYAPTSIDTAQGSIAIVANGLEPVMIDLAGVAFSQKLILSRNNVSFDAVRIGQSSAIVPVTLTNPSTMSAGLTGISVVAGAGIYSQANNCSTVLPSGESCVINVQVTPTATAVPEGSVVVASSFGNYTLKLTGSGVKPQGELSIGGDSGDGSNNGSGVGSGQAILFNDTPVGSTSPSRSVTFKNVGNGPLGITGISIVTAQGIFAQSNNCGNSLAAGSSCTITMVFTPTASGAAQGQLAIITPEGNYTLALKGSGLSSSGVWSATSSTTFGTLMPGATKQLGFSFINRGTGSLPVSVSLTGSPDVSLTANNCGVPGAPVTLTQGQYCAVMVQYKPSSAPSTLSGVSLVASSSQLATPVSLTLQGKASGYGLLNESSTSGIFGELVPTNSISRFYTIRNVAKVSDTLRSVAITGEGFTKGAGTTCVANKVMAANSTCRIEVVATAPMPSVEGKYAMAGQFEVVSVNDASASLALSGSYSKVDIELTWSQVSGDWSTYGPGLTTSVSYQLNNKTGKSMTLTETAAITLDSGFTLASNNCKTGTLIRADSSCTVTIRAALGTPLAAGDYSYVGSMVGKSPSGFAVEKTFGVSYTQDPYEVAFDVQDTNFGSYTTGLSSVNTSVVFRNTSKTSTVTVDSANIALSAESIINLNRNTVAQSCRNNGSANTVLPPGSTCVLPFVITLPKGLPAGAHTYPLDFTIGTKEGASASAHASFTFVQEEYTISGSSGDFGTVAKNGTAVKTITFTNTSLSTQVITGSVDGGDFTISVNNCSNRSVAPGGNCAMTVKAKAPAVAASTNYGTARATNTMGFVVEVPMTVSSR